MRHCLPLAIALPLFSAAAIASPLPDIGFPGLTAHRFESLCTDAASVHFDPALATAKDVFTTIEDHPAGGWRTVLQGRLAKDGPVYEVRFDDGPSCDPEFSLWLPDAEEPVGSFGGEHLVVPGNGFLYVVRSSNRSFEGREKWRVNGETVEEVAQPFYYVGASTKTLRAVALRAQPDAVSDVLANVPAGETVTVVLQQAVDDRDYYLVRSRFGLLGWTADAGYGEERQFEAIEFHGD